MAVKRLPSDSKTNADPSPTFAAAPMPERIQIVAGWLGCYFIVFEQTLNQANAQKICGNVEPGFFTFLLTVVDGTHAHTHIFFSETAIKNKQ